MSGTILSFAKRPLSKFEASIAFLIGFGILFYFYSDCVNRQWDFPVYYLAAKAVANHQNPYDPSILQSIADAEEEVGYGGGLPYLYPPHLARMLSLFGKAPFFASSFFWMTFKCAALEMILFLSFALMRIPVTPLALIVGNIAALFFRPAALDFNAGNAATFEYALILAGLYAWSRSRFCAAGFFTILGGSIKGTSLLITLYPIHLRDWRFLRALTIAAIILGCFLVWDWRILLRFFEFYQSPLWKQMWDEQVQSFYNCSYATVILRTFSYTYFAEPILAIPLLSTILIPLFPLFIFASMAFFLQKQRRQSQSLFNPTSGIVLSMILCGVLLLPPRLAGYTLIWTLFPFFQIIHTSWKNRIYIALPYVLTGLILIQLNLPPNHIPHGIPQLLIDKDFFGLLLLFISSLLLIQYSSKPTVSGQEASDYEA
ncbi:MAG: DUF2029 domain-containing protein [Candidatus Omnitrophica bacterium]|nr:DUF2029 domain-containing protein [Candidatus Omnitrophota bacterium]